MATKKESMLINLWKYEASVQSAHAISKVNKRKKVKFENFDRGFFVWNDLLYYKCDDAYTIDAEGEEISFDMYRELKEKKIYTHINLNFVPIGVFNTIMCDIVGTVDYIMENKAEVEKALSYIEEEHQTLLDLPRIYNEEIL